MTTERMYEQAEQHEQAQRDDGVLNARIALSGVGCDECEDCDCPIPIARKQAIPSATRCIDCQEQHEQGR